MNKEKLSFHTDRKIRSAIDNIEVKTAAAWMLTAISFSHIAIFSKQEKEQTIRYINGLLFYSADPFKTYLEYSQRVLLTRQYLRDNYISGQKLSTWLKDKFIPVSEIWFKSLLRMRKANPLHRHELKALPEAVLNMMEEPTTSMFDYWITWFKEKKAEDELQIFLAFTLIIHFKSDSHE